MSSDPWTIGHRRVLSSCSMAPKRQEPRLYFPHSPGLPDTLDIWYIDLHDLQFLLLLSSWFEFIIDFFFLLCFSVWAADLPPQYKCLRCSRSVPYVIHLTFHCRLFSLWRASHPYTKYEVVYSIRSTPYIVQYSGLYRTVDTVSRENLEVFHSHKPNSLNNLENSIVIVYIYLSISQPIFNWGGYPESNEQIYILMNIINYISTPTTN